MLSKLSKNEYGATAIEYGLIAALIALGAVTGFQAVGEALDGTFGVVAGELAPDRASPPPDST